MFYYTRDVILEPDNGTSERALRPITIGRDNWMFLGNKRGGEAMGVLMSLVQTCRAMDINALTYLEDVLRHINGHPAQHPAVQFLQNIFREKEDSLFQWIRSPDIPCENNYAERGLRPLVVTRKISYGSQSERGMKTREILTSVLHTAAARGLEPAAFLEAFLNDSRNASLLFS